MMTSRKDDTDHNCSRRGWGGSGERRGIGDVKEAMARLAKEKSIKKKERKLNDKSKHPSSETRDGYGNGRKTSSINSRYSSTSDSAASTNNNDATTTDLKNGIWTPSSTSASPSSSPASPTMVEKFHCDNDNSCQKFCSEVHDSILFTIVEEEDPESDGACESDHPGGAAVDLRCQQNRRQNHSMEPRLLLEEDGVTVGNSVQPSAAVDVATSAWPQSMSKHTGMKVVERGDASQNRNIYYGKESSTTVKASGTAAKTSSSATALQTASSATPLRTESSATTSKTASSATASKAASAATATETSAVETKTKSAATSSNEDVKLTPSPPPKTWGQILRHKNDEVSLLTDDPKDSFHPVPLIIAFIPEEKHERDVSDSRHHYKDCDVLDAVAYPHIMTTRDDDYNRMPQNSRNQQEKKMCISYPNDDADDESIHCDEESSCSSYNGSNPSNLTEEQKDEINELISHDGSVNDDNSDDAQANTAAVDETPEQNHQLTKERMGSSSSGCVLVCSEITMLDSDLLCSSYYDSNPSNLTEIDELISHDGSDYGDNRDDTQANTSLVPEKDQQLTKALAAGSSGSGCVLVVPEIMMLDLDLLYDDLDDKDIDELKSIDDSDCGKKYDETQHFRVKTGAISKQPQQEDVERGWVSSDDVYCNVDYYGRVGGLQQPQLSSTQFFDADLTIGDKGSTEGDCSSDSLSLFSLLREVQPEKQSMQTSCSDVTIRRHHSFLLDGTGSPHSGIDDGAISVDCVGNDAPDSSFIDIFSGRSSDSSSNSCSSQIASSQSYSTMHSSTKSATYTDDSEIEDDKNDRQQHSKTLAYSKAAVGGKNNKAHNYSGSSSLSGGNQEPGLDQSSHQQQSNPSIMLISHRPQRKKNALDDQSFGAEVVDCEKDFCVAVDSNREQDTKSESSVIKPEMSTADRTKRNLHIEGFQRRRKKNHQVVSKTTQNIGKEEEEDNDDAEHASCDGVDVTSPLFDSNSLFEQRLTLRRWSFPAQTSATEAKKGKGEDQEDIVLLTLRQSCPPLLFANANETMLKKRRSFRKKCTNIAGARGEPAYAVTAPANTSCREGIANEKRSHGNCTAEDGTPTASIIPADIIAPRHLVYTNISTHCVQSRKDHQSSNDLDPARLSEHAKDDENYKHVVNQEFQDGNYVSIKSDEQETAIVEEHYARRQQNSQSASHHRVRNHGRGHQQHQHIRNHGVVQGGCASIRYSKGAYNDLSSKRISPSDYTGDRPPRHYESINCRIATNDGRGLERDGSNVSWEDLEYAVKACMTVSLSETNEKFNANNNCGNFLQPDASVYTQGQEISNYSKELGRSHDVSWDELGDAITKGRIISMSEIAKQVVQKQQQEWDLEAGRKESRRHEGLADKPWQCATCTFINENGTFLVCGVCDTPRYQLTNDQVRAKDK